MIFQVRSMSMSFVSPRRLLCALALVGMPLAGQAAELVVRDLDAALILRPTTFDFTVSTASVESTGTDSWSSGSGLEVGYRHSLSFPGDSLGLVVGISGATDGYIYNEEGTLGTLTGRPSLGLGYAPFDGWTFIAEAGYSAGMGTLELPASKAAPAFSAVGGGSGVDVRGSVWWAVNRRLLIGAMGGWQTMTWKLSGDNSTDMEFTQAGVHFGLGVAWRFSNSPTTLE